MRLKKVRISREMLLGILAYAFEAYPNEMVLLLKADRRGGTATVSGIVFPPYAVGGPYYAILGEGMMPPDPNIIGSVHSHPSGSLEPSEEDLIHGRGPAIMIVAYPYMESSVVVYNKQGERLDLEIF